MKIKIMKKFYLVLLVLGMFVGFLSSCDDDDNDTPELPVVTIESEDGSFSMLPTESIVLKAKVSSSQVTDWVWFVNGEKVGTDSVYTFKAEKLGDYNVAILASNTNGEAYASTMIEVHGTYKYGTFVISEGSRSPGTIVFISPKGEVIDNAYYVENGGELGGATQDLFIKDNKMYIVSQNGGYDGGFLTILNAETLKRERKFQEELDGEVSMPTHVVALGEDDIYLRDNNGVKRFQPSTGKVTLIEGTESARKNTMVVADGKVFATVGTSVVVIEAGKDEIANTIEFEDRVSGVIKVHPRGIIFTTRAFDTIQGILGSSTRISRQQRLIVHPHISLRIHHFDFIRRHRGYCLVTYRSIYTPGFSFFCCHDNNPICTACPVHRCCRRIF